MAKLCQLVMAILLIIGVSSNLLNNLNDFDKHDLVVLVSYEKFRNEVLTYLDIGETQVFEHVLLGKSEEDLKGAVKLLIKNNNSLDSDGFFENLVSIPSGGYKKFIKNLSEDDLEQLCCSILAYSNNYYYPDFKAVFREFEYSDTKEEYIECIDDNSYNLRNKIQKILFKEPGKYEYHECEEYIALRKSKTK